MSWRACCESLPATSQPAPLRVSSNCIAKGAAAAITRAHAATTFQGCRVVMVARNEKALFIQRPPRSGCPWRTCFFLRPSVAAGRADESALRPDLLDEYLPEQVAGPEQLGIGDTVEDLIALLPAGEDPQPAHDAQVLRHVGVGHAQPPGQVARAHLAFAQVVYDRQASGAGEDLAHFGVPLI